MAFTTFWRKLRSGNFLKNYSKNWETLWLTKKKSLVIKNYFNITVEKDKPICVIMRLGTALVTLVTVMFATPVTCGTRFQKSLLGNICVDYCNHVLQILNMEINFSQLLKNVQKRCGLQSIYGVFSWRNTYFRLIHRLSLCEQLYWNYRSVSNF